MLKRNEACVLVAILAAVVLAACGSEGAASDVRTPTVAEPEPRCREGWSHYRDPEGRYSFCYPQAMALRVSRQEPYPVSVELATAIGSPSPSEANIIAFSIFWRAQSRFQAGTFADRCRLEQQHFAVPTHEVAMTIAGQNAFACRAQGSTPTHGVAPMEVELADVKDSGSLRVGVLFGHDLAASSPLIDGIITSLRIPAEP